MTQDNPGHGEAAFRVEAGARIARALELLEDGRSYDDRSIAADVADEVAGVLLDIEIDLAGPPPSLLTFACPECGARFQWPGLRDQHLLLAHDLDEIAA
jgi:hypothetical protein